MCRTARQTAGQQAPHTAGQYYTSIDQADGGQANTGWTGMAQNGRGETRRAVMAVRSRAHSARARFKLAGSGTEARVWLLERLGLAKNAV